jgi:diaminohydroxyphosphoribosylaminopyrimidine deaminase/5-amino-6-(5-phosphoribosylamino)uracil reductase
MQPELDDRRFMHLALALGRRGLGRVWPNPAVGAVVVRQESSGPVIVGRGWTQPGGRPHAEPEALRRAGAAARGATLYVTLEPCSHYGKSPPCADAVVAAGIARVVAAIEDPNPEVAGKGFARLKAAGIAVDVGLGAAEARRDHAGFLRRIADGRPNVTLKLAVTADDKAGAAGRRPLVITGAPARVRAHLMRAQNDAILVGIGTVLADDPELTCRLPGMSGRSPVRIVLDGRLRLPLSSRLVAAARAVPLWVMTASDAPMAAEQALRERGAEVIRVAPRKDGLDLTEILACLGERGLTRLLVEGGPIVAASFLAHGLIDEAVLMRSSRAIGGDGIDALEGLPLSVLSGGPQFRRLAVESLGDDTVELFARV